MDKVRKPNISVNNKSVTQELSCIVSTNILLMLHYNHSSANRTILFLHNYSNTTYYQKLLPSFKFFRNFIND
jgi:hypothetical protein